MSVRDANTYAITMGAARVGVAVRSASVYLVRKGEESAESSTARSYIGRVSRYTRQPRFSSDNLMHKRESRYLQR